MARHCSKCGQEGHYSKTCGKPKEIITTPEPTTPSTITQSPTAFSAVMPVSDGSGDPISPYTHRGFRQGLWLINMDKGRLAGKIKRITKESVIYDSLSGAEVESSIKTIVNSNYISVDLEPIHVVKLLQSHKIKDY